jgi:phosphoribosylformimino-5-aminoimidazole carboxamide ribotide isomerase
LIANSFTIFPAIDLRAGKVVRLAQGDPARQTTYGDDPLLWAERWKSAGANWLHIVNLDGAFGEDSRLNLQAIESILGIGLNVEFGGGIRDRVSIGTAFDLGIRRVFLGTAAVLNPALVDWAIATYGPACIAGDIGMRSGKVAVKGWQETTPLTGLEVGQRFHAQGLKRCVLTNVQNDGVNNGVDLQSAVELQNVTGLQVVVSGGIGRSEDVRHSREAGLAGVIIGRALFDGQLSLSDVIKVYENE